MRAVIPASALGKNRFLAVLTPQMMWAMKRVDLLVMRQQAALNSEAESAASTSRLVPANVQASEFADFLTRAAEESTLAPLKEVHGATINRIMHFYDPSKSA